jgi:hypothetical protein
MNDDEWQNLTEQGERLKWARRRWQKSIDQRDDAGMAAEVLGIKAGTYRAYERAPESSKFIRLNDEIAVRIARRYKVSWRWLLRNEGTPFDVTLPAPQQRVTRLMSTVDEDQQEAIAEVVETYVRGLTKYGSGSTPT